MHWLLGRELTVLVGRDCCTTDVGTGLVHTAPGHGVEDYQASPRKEQPHGSVAESASLYGCVLQCELPFVVGGVCITTYAGTGLAQTAPGNGAEDYQASSVEQTARYSACT